MCTALGKTAPQAPDINGQLTHTIPLWISCESRPLCGRVMCGVRAACVPIDLDHAACARTEHAPVCVNSPVLQSRGSRSQDSQETRDSCVSLRGWRPQGHRRLRLAPAGAVRRAGSAGRMPSGEVYAAPYRSAEPAPGAAPVRGPPREAPPPLGSRIGTGAREGGESSKLLRLGCGTP